MIDDLSKTIKAQLYERINSPLLGSFLLSWATWNYKFIVVLFSAMTVEKTFAYIDQTLYPNWTHSLWILLIGPAITAALIIFVYPYPAKFVYEYARKRQKELKEIQQKIDDETPLTKEEAKEIRTEASKKAIELEVRLQQRDQEVGRLRAENDDLWRKIMASEGSKKIAPDLVATDEKAEKVKANNKKTAAPINNPSQLTQDQVQFLITLTKSAANGRVETEDFLHRVDGKSLTTQYNRDILKKRGYITDAYGRIDITSEGRAYLVESKIIT
jgi:predicted RNase H-related nuclease YkuK (DUF458 family)